MSLRVLIADDEALARDRLRQFLKAESGVEIVGECANGIETVKCIREKSPDVVFLDVHMPELDGFAVLRALNGEPLPVVIFVTAYDQYAVRAFEEHAVDYLLKPFDSERFQRSLRRAREITRPRKNDHSLQQVLQLLGHSTALPKRVERLMVKTSGRIVWLNTSEIDWIRGADNYLELHVGKSVHLLRQTIAALEDQLPPEQFIRISRSLIVNLDRIAELRPRSHGDRLVILRDGTQLMASRKYRSKLNRFVDGRH